eukprot:SAG31_NODE_5746_length_2348_cov_1.336739_4_plen_158_part_00
MHQSPAAVGADRASRPPAPQAIWMRGDSAAAQKLGGNGRFGGKRKLASRRCSGGTSAPRRSAAALRAPRTTYPLTMMSVRIALAAVQLTPPELRTQSAGHAGPPCWERRRRRRRRRPQRRLDVELLWRRSKTPRGWAADCLEIRVLTHRNSCNKYLL